MAESNPEFELVTEIAVPECEGGRRIDQFLPGALSEFGAERSRRQVQEWIKEGFILLNGRKVKPKSPVEPGDLVLVKIPCEETPVLEPEDMELSILFEDDDLIVVDKPAGLVVHPGAGNSAGTLVNGLLYHCRGQLAVENAAEERPGIVHRLDKETSGCLVAAKSERAYTSLVGQFSSRETEKWYVAVACGIPAQLSGRIETQIGRHPVHRQKMTVLEPPRGKLAITEYEVKNQDEKGNWSWIDCRIHTGRTHQIRVHLRECLRCPILGDSIYAQPQRQKTSVSRLMLHARSLVIRHPETGERISFEAPLPPEFMRFRRVSSDS